MFILFLSFSCKDKDIDPTVELSYPTYFGDPKIPSDNLLTENKILLGRKLFYEKKLSKDKTVSCGSCHVQKFAFSDPNTFSFGVEGQITTRNSMSLANLGWQNQFFWDNRSSSLEKQALIPIEAANEMNLPIEEAIARLQASVEYRSLFNKVFGSPEITKERLAQAISSFERTLISGTSKYDLFKQGLTTFTQDEQDGERLFFTHPDPTTNLRGGNCGDCHSGLLTQSPDPRNNGLLITNDTGIEALTGDPENFGEFKTVSLRNIELTAPYMHDGRFKTLEDVLDHYNSPEAFKRQNVDPLITLGTNDINGTSLGLTDDEKRKIIAFLKTLTDYQFISDEKFSDPNQ